MNKDHDLIDLEEDIKELKDNLVFDITGLQSCEVIHSGVVCTESPIGTCVYDSEDDIKKCVFCEKEKPASTLEERVRIAKTYIDEKIKRSFKYDYGFDTDHPSDRLFTETVIEMQLIEAMLDGIKGLECLNRGEH